MCKYAERDLWTNLCADKERDKSNVKCNFAQKQIPTQMKNLFYFQRMQFLYSMCKI